ncbi:MAG: GNAT family N-acetyltransferase [Promethearchaeota archaeon]
MAKLLLLMQSLLQSGQQVPLKKASLSFSDQKNQVNIEIYPHIGQTSDLEKKLMEQQIYRLIEINLEYQVIGTYTARNIYTRPENTFIFIRSLDSEEKNPLNLILNIAPQKQIIFFGHPDIPKEVLPWLVTILQQFSGYFLFGSGQKFTDAVLTGLDINTKLHNVTYNLDDLIRPLRLHPALRVVIFNEHYLQTAVNSIELNQLKAFYEYPDTPDEIQARIRKNPHTLGYINEIPVGSARTNEITDRVAVIGGVKTLLSYRHQKVGVTICYTFFQWLISQNKQIVLETDVNNFPARRIYEGLGFSQTGYSIFIDNHSGVLAEIIGDRDY